MSEIISIEGKKAYHVVLTGKSLLFLPVYHKTSFREEGFINVQSLSQKFEISKKKSIEVYANGKWHEFQIKVIGKENVEVPAGKFNTLIARAFMILEKFFGKKGKIMIWLTNDSRHIPVKINVDTESSFFMLGSITAVLKNSKI